MKYKGFVDVTVCGYSVLRISNSLFAAISNTAGWVYQVPLMLHECICDSRRDCANEIDFCDSVPSATSESFCQFFAKTSLSAS